MSFLSPIFWPCLLLLCFVYFSLSGPRQNTILLIASLLYQASWSWFFPLLFLATAVWIFFCAQKIQLSEDRLLWRKIYLWIGLAPVAGMFFCFKYQAHDFSAHIAGPDPLRFL